MVHSRPVILKFRQIPPCGDGMSRAAMVTMALTNQTSTVNRGDAPRPVPIRLLRLAAVLDRTGLSRSTIWRLEKAGKFPRRRRVSASVVAWLESEVTAWIQASASRLGE